MSLAQRFRHHQPFPQCITGAADSLWNDLSLEQAMHLAWNLEGVELGFACSASFQQYDGTTPNPSPPPDFFPPSAVHTWAVNYGCDTTPPTLLGQAARLYNPGPSMLMGAQWGPTSSPPSIVRQPRDRVCVGTTPSVTHLYLVRVVASINGSGVTAPYISGSITFELALRRSAAFPGRWTVAPSIDMIAGFWTPEPRDTTSQTPVVFRLRGPNPPPLGSYSAVVINTTGVLDIAGHQLPYTIIGGVVGALSNSQYSLSVDGITFVPRFYEYP